MSERRGRSAISERRTTEGMESYLINLSMKRAAEMLENGTAPAQIISHFLKLGTEKAKYEQEKLKAETKLSISKAELIESQKKSDEIAAEALKAFKRYAGFNDDMDDGDYDDY